MKIVGIVSEYNPFHNGHKYQIDMIKEKLNADYIISIMSSNYVQRGEPAIYDKFTRAKAAVLGGCDLVLELPTIYSCASAEFFASASIELMDKLNSIDFLVFGSENGNVKDLNELADFLLNESDDFKSHLKLYLKGGYSFAKARSLAIHKCYKNSDTLLKGSNNILGIEYLKALKRLNSTITPYTIKRNGDDYLCESLNNTICSATAIRKSIVNSNSIHGIKHYIPKEVYYYFKKKSLYPVYNEDLFSHLQYLLQANENVDEIYDFNTQLFNRLQKNILGISSHEQLLAKTSSKNYNRSSINRSLLHLFLNIKKQDINKIDSSNYISYARILAFNKSSSPLLKKLKSKSSIPLISNLNKDYKLLNNFGKSLIQKEIKYTNLYNLLVFNKYNVSLPNERQLSPIVI